MIDIRVDPKKPGQMVYVALRRCSYSSAWIPITANTYYDKPEAALAACIEHLREVWTELQERIELLRTLCEHSEFQGQQMNPELVLNQVHELENFTDAHTPEIRRLDKSPDSEQTVCLHPEHHDEERASQPCRHLADSASGRGQANDRTDDKSVN